MKKQVAGVTFIALVISLILSSYREGPALSHGWDCTGAETGLQNPSGCSSGSGCHASSATAGITVALELDSAGVPVTKYVGGKTYSVKITGTNTTSTSLPGFGFQISSIKDSTAQVTPTNEGTWGTPTGGLQYAAPQSGNFVLNIIEQSNTLTATTGGGAQGSTYVRSISWTAPVASTGTISFWAALNAVNDNNNADEGDKWNVNHLVVDEEDSAVVVPNGVTTLTENNNVRLYPNPVGNELNLQWANAQAGIYTVSVYNVSGQLVATQKTELNATANNLSLNSANWAAGIYILNLEAGNTRQVFKVVKQ